jgi:hypothetical protein
VKLENPGAFLQNDAVLLGLTGIDPGPIKFLDCPIQIGRLATAGATHDERRLAGDSERRQTSPARLNSSRGARFRVRVAPTRRGRHARSIQGNGDGSAVETVRSTAGRTATAAGPPASSTQRLGARRCQQAATVASSPCYGAPRRLLDDRKAAVQEINSGGRLGFQRRRWLHKARV